MNSPIGTPNSHQLADRKIQHLELAQKSQTSGFEVDSRFNYEPLFFAHDSQESWKTSFLKHQLDFPLWISSMTGGTAMAQTINQNLSRLVGKYRLGMGLGSCRPLLESSERLKDFALRANLSESPFFANLGVAQVEELLSVGKAHLIDELVKKIEADGLIIHINPLQEWFQPEGDKYKRSPLQTLRAFLEKCHYPVIVKEVGQGMGPKSMKALMDLPLAGIEFGAFGGTNFSLLENLRSQNSMNKEAFIHVGHTAREMVGFVNALGNHNKEIIISGGVKTPLDAFELLNLCQSRSLIGMAYAFLKPASESFEVLENFYLSFRDAVLTARGLLEIKGE